MVHRSSRSILAAILGVALALAPAVSVLSTPATPSGSIERVSLTAEGSQAPDPSYGPAVSDDGRWVAFASYAPLTSEDDDRSLDVFVRDRQAGTLELVSIGPAEDPIVEDAGLLGMSADGAIVYLWERLGDAPPGSVHWDLNRVLARDRQAGVTRELIRDVVAADTSSNAAWLAYLTEQGSPLATQVHLMDIGTGQTWVIATAGTVFGVAVADPGDVAFDTTASMIATDIDSDRDTYLWTRSTGTSEIVSQGDGITNGMLLDLAPDASAVALFSDPDWYGKGSYSAWDRAAGTATIVGHSSQPEFSSPAAAVSIDGRFLAYTWTRSGGVMPEKLRLVDREAGTVERVDANDGGMACRDRWSFAPWISSDGRYVGFTSDCSMLVPGDTNYKMDVFLRDRATPAPVGLPDLAFRSQQRWIGTGELGSLPGELGASVFAQRIPSTSWVKARVRNGGNADATFLLRGTDGPRWLRVTYLLDETNVTSSVLTGTFATPTLHPGEAVVVRLRIRVRPRADPCVSGRIRLRASTLDSSWTDAGLLQVDVSCPP